MMQLVIRNHPRQWNNCLERLQKEIHLSPELAARLRSGQSIPGLDPMLLREIERFMNRHLPSHGRTLMELAEMRDQWRGEDPLAKIWNLRIVQILWPRQKDPSGNDQAEKFAESLGVTIPMLNDNNNEPGPMDMNALLKHVQGDYLWIIPGGTRLASAFATMSLVRVLRSFEEKPKLGSYSDQCYCLIYRTAALRTLIASGRTLSSESRENGRMLHDAGFEFAADNDLNLALAILEPFYGGKQMTQSLQ
jgi:hypothetical protein